MRRFFRRLFVECPFILLLADPEGGTACRLPLGWIYEDNMTEQIERTGMSDFCNARFRG